MKIGWIFDVIPGFDFSTKQLNKKKKKNFYFFSENNKYLNYLKRHFEG